MCPDRCEVDVWKLPSPIPREELLKRIPGKDALFCLLTEKIDKEVLDAAGKEIVECCHATQVVCVLCGFVN